MSGYSRCAAYFLWVLSLIQGWMDNYDKATYLGVLAILLWLLADSQQTRPTSPGGAS